MDRLISNLMSTYKNTLSITEDQEAILQYSLRLVVGSCLSYFWALAIALLLGNLPQVLIIMLTISVLRIFSGGAHCSTMRNCIIYGTVITNILGIVTKASLPSKAVVLFLAFSVMLFSLWTIHKYAPADTPGKPIQTKQKRDKLKSRSFVVVFLWIFLATIAYTYSLMDYRMIYASVVGILWQSASLTRAGYKFCSIIHTVLNRLQRKEGTYI